MNLFYALSPRKACRFNYKSLDKGTGRDWYAETGRNRDTEMRQPGNGLAARQCGEALPHRHGPQNLLRLRLRIPRHSLKGKKKGADRCGKPLPTSRSVPISASPGLRVLLSITDIFQARTPASYIRIAESPGPTRGSRFHIFKVIIRGGSDHGTVR